MALQYRQFLQVIGPSSLNIVSLEPEKLCAEVPKMRLRRMEPLIWSLAFFIFSVFQCGRAAYDGTGFVRRDRTHFVVNGRPFNSNGFNAYWLMYMASFPEERSKVSAAFQQAASHGLTLVRTWAYRDGGFRPLQSSPGVYQEDVFQGLDFVISEARKYGVHLILSLTNYFDNFGGRPQYIKWARDEGRSLGSDDDFYTDDLVKTYYKNHVKTILTRVNTFTGVAYKDDPIIFAWELINEPHCQSDLSGNTLQAWIEEMAAYAKSIDSNHLLEIGLEGFYGETIPERKKFNVGHELGTDFIRNNQVESIDFATIHVYPDLWMAGSTNQTQMAFLRAWIQSHIEDSEAALGKPLLITEFGKSLRFSSSSSSSSAAEVVDERERENVFNAVYNAIYASARGGGACGGGLFWQLLLGEQAMDAIRDGYEVIFSESPFLARIIARQSHRISKLNRQSLVRHPTHSGGSWSLSSS